LYYVYFLGSISTSDYDCWQLQIVASQIDREDPCFISIIVCTRIIENAVVKLDASVHLHLYSYDPQDRI